MLNACLVHVAQSPPAYIIPSLGKREWSPITVYDLCPQDSLCQETLAEGCIVCFAIFA